jgi:hypothetical protein
MEENSTRQCIKDAFIQLLGKNHIKKINVSKVAKEAYIQRSTFYLYLIIFRIFFFV